MDGVAQAVQTIYAQRETEAFADGDEETQTTTTCEIYGMKKAKRVMTQWNHTPLQGFGALPGYHECLERWVNLYTFQTDIPMQTRLFILSLLMLFLFGACDTSSHGHDHDHGPHGEHKHVQKDDHNHKKDHPSDHQHQKDDHQHDDHDHQHDDHGHKHGDHGHKHGKGGHDHKHDRQHAAGHKSTLKVEMAGTVVEKSSAVKNSDSWHAPSDPFYMLHKDKGGKVILRPSKTVSTKELKKYEGKHVLIFGYPTSGKPYKPTGEESYPAVGPGPDGKPVQLLRGKGFVVQEILSRPK